tara:strand:- start:8668 stop:9297 length:630 start_codon:yes stop_codon:yes gene_type:complete
MRNTKNVMTKVNTYTYSKKNLFEITEKYQNTSFHGLEFLKHYTESRQTLILELRKKSTETVRFKQILDIIQKKINLFESKKDGNRQTENIFYNICLDINNEAKIFEINKYIKKFEVTKKIFSTYDMNLKPITEDYTIVRNYLLLSLICLLKYKKSKKIQFLSTILKLNDIICSQIYKIDELDDILFSQYVLKLELKYINELATRKGIVI